MTWLDEEHSEWMREIKRRYRCAQSRAAVKVNSEQLLFCWISGGPVGEQLRAT